MYIILEWVPYYFQWSNVKNMRERSESESKIPATLIAIVDAYPRLNNMLHYKHNIHVINVNGSAVGIRRCLIAE